MRFHARRIGLEPGEKLESAERLADVHVPAVRRRAAKAPPRLQERDVERHVGDLRYPHGPPQELVRDRHAGMLGHADGRGLDEAARKTFAATPKITKPMEGGMIFHGAMISYMNMISCPEMANVLLRRLDAATLSRLRADARRRGISVNRLIVETLQREHGGRETHDDLDALAGCWSTAEAARFDAAVAPFSKIDPALWAQQPKGAYRVKRRRSRPRR